MRARSVGGEVRSRPVLGRPASHLRARGLTSRFEFCPPTIRQEGRHEVQNDEILLTRKTDRLSRRLEFWQNEVVRRTGPSQG